MCCLNYRVKQSRCVLLDRPSRRSEASLMSTPIRNAQLKSVLDTLTNEYKKKVSSSLLPPVRAFCSRKHRSCLYHRRVQERNFSQWQKDNKSESIFSLSDLPSLTVSSYPYSRRQAASIGSRRISIPSSSCIPPL